jgi:hypothetical protein
LLKGLSHEIFGPVFWPACMHLELNVNRFGFLDFNDAPLILDDYFVSDVFQAVSFLRFLESGEGLATEPLVLQFSYIFG